MLAVILALVPFGIHRWSSWFVDLVVCLLITDSHLSLLPGSRLDSLWLCVPFKIWLTLLFIHSRGGLSCIPQILGSLLLHRTYHGKLPGRSASFWSFLGYVETGKGVREARQLAMLGEVPWKLASVWSCRGVSYGLDFVSIWRKGARLSDSGYRSVIGSALTGKEGARHVGDINCGHSGGPQSRTQLQLPVVCPPKRPAGVGIRNKGTEIGGAYAEIAKDQKVSR